MILGPIAFIAPNNLLLKMTDGGLVCKEVQVTGG